MEQITRIRLDQLHESPFNPRRSFNEATLQELAGDIASQGVLQPLLVRPHMPNPLFPEHDPQDGWQIVFGHRRFRAAQLAAATGAFTLGTPASVPCMVRMLTDEEAKRAQISENLAREDVHPIEEAEGFQALMHDHGVTADALVEQTGKSRSYVYGRLKLLQACKTVRDACLAGEIGSEVALLVARLRTDKLQAKALGYIKGKYIDMGDGGSKSFRQIRSLLNERFTLELKSAMFDTEDAALLPEAGACGDCPKRTGNAPEFDDIAQAGDRGRNSTHSDWLRRGGADICTDPDCFDEKKKAHLRLKAGELRAKGKEVVDGAKARVAIDAHGNVKGAYIALKDVKAELKALPKKGSAAAQDAKTPQVVTIQDPRTGKTVEAVRREDLKAAGVKVKEAPKGHAANYEAQRERAEAERKRLEEKAQVERKVRMALLTEIRDAAVDSVRNAFDLRLIAAAAWAGVQWRDKEALQDTWCIKGANDVEAVLEKMDAQRLALFALDCALIGDVRVEAYDLKRQPHKLLSAAEYYGIDVEAVRAELQTPAPAAPTPSPAARAPKKAKAAPAAKKRVGAPMHPTHGFGVVKYRDEATGSTWSGRGLQPAWLKAALKAGKQLSDFAVDAAPAARAKKPKTPLKTADADAPDDAGLFDEDQTDDAGSAGGSDATAGALEEEAA